MGSQDDVVELEQRPRVRLLPEGVERRTGDTPRAQRLDQRRLVHELAPCRVDDADSGLRELELANPDQVSRLGRERGVQGHEVRHLEQPLERGNVLHARLAHALGRDERVVGDDVHRQAAGPPGYLLADTAEADDAERLLGQLDSREAGALPPSVLQRGVRLRDRACQRQKEPDGVLGRRDDGGLRRVDDENAAFRRRVDVHVVDPDARPADHAKPRGLLEQVRRHLGRAANDEPVVCSDAFLERAVEIDVDVEAGPQQVDARLGDALADQDSRTLAHVAARPFTPAPRRRRHLGPPRARRPGRSTRRTRQARARVPRARRRRRRGSRSRCARCARSSPSALPDRRRP